MAEAATELGVVAAETEMIPCLGQSQRGPWNLPRRQWLPELEAKLNLAFGRNLNPFNIKNVNIYIRGKKEDVPKIGAKIDSKTFCHVSLLRGESKKYSIY